MIDILKKIESLWRKPFNGLLLKYRFGVVAFGLVLCIIFLFRVVIGEVIYQMLNSLFSTVSKPLQLSEFSIAADLVKPTFYIPSIIVLLLSYVVGNIFGWAAFENSTQIGEDAKKNAFIERLLSASPVGAFMTDKDGVITYTNSMAHKIFSPNLEETVAGRNLSDIDLVANTVMAETVEKLQNSYAGVLQNEVAFKKSPQAEVEWFQCTLSPVTLASDRIGSIGWINDTTQQKRKQQDVIHSIILALTKAIDAKDRGTHEHSMRVRKIALIIAKYLNMPPEKFPNLEYASLLHDVGKILLPDDILQGRAKLSPEQKEIIFRLPEYSASFLDGIDDLSEVKDIVYFQKEWYVPPKAENSQYKPFPAIKTGNAIPLESRIIAVADAFEGMTTEKSYKKAMPKDIAVIEFKRSSGIKPTEDEINRLIFHYKQEKNDSMSLDELLSHSRVERQFDYKIVNALEAAIQHNEI